MLNRIEYLSSIIEQLLENSNERDSQWILILLQDFKKLLNEERYAIEAQTKMNVEAMTIGLNIMNGDGIIYNRHDGNDLPPKKIGWEHSEQVLVYYTPVVDGPTSSFGIAYYHYAPPFADAYWADYKHPGRVPKYWWSLPKKIEE